jgi:hypothetical protein
VSPRLATPATSAADHQEAGFPDGPVHVASQREPALEASCGQVLTSINGLELPMS